MIYFISDIHFSDERIMRLCHRPFENSFEMDEAIIEKWNKKVDLTDTVYVLGDLGLKESLSLYLRLNGKKNLIVGNHDEKMIDEIKEANIFSDISYYKKVEIDGVDVILCHYPIMDWENNHLGSIHIYGHIHNKRLDDIKNYYKDKRAYNASLDVNDFEPMTLKELIERK